MNVYRLIIIVLQFVMFTSFKGFSENKPLGLLTDLIEYTDRVYINGYLSNLPIWEVEKAIDPGQYVRICSTHPSFSWIVPGKEQNIVQSAYHIIVADSLCDALDIKGSIWDSGMVKSSQSIAVLHAGTQLLPDKMYYWRVKTVNNQGDESQWSDVKAFRTGVQLGEYTTPFYPLLKSREEPESLYAVNDSVWFMDFGKASFAQLELTLTSKYGNETIWVHLGEKCNDKRINRNPGGSIRYKSQKLSLVKGTNTYKIVFIPDKRNSGPAAVKMPAYIGEVYPFRFCEIENYSEVLKPKDIIRESVNSHFENGVSYFQSDNDTLNQIWDFCKYSIKATSFMGVYIDGDRERIPYEADALINQLCHYSVDREFTMARRSLEYLLEYPTWPTEWIIQAVLIAWNDFMYTGDIRFLKANYEILKARTLTQLKDENGLITTTRGKHTSQFLASIRFTSKIKDIVDWPHTGILGLEKNVGGEADGFVFTDYNSVTNAYHYESVQLMSKIADVLGLNKEAELFRHESDKFKKTYNDAFYDITRECYKDGVDTEHASLHSNMFALAFDLVPEDCKLHVLNYIKSRKMACSVYGSQFLMDAVYDVNDEKYAFSLLTATHDRSWYNMIRSGSTISMEAWDNKYKPNQDWNHAWGAVPANIIPRKLLGVIPLEPGFSVVQIKPQISLLTKVKSVIPTIRGGIYIDIDKSSTDDGAYRLKVIIPANMFAEIYLPYFPKKLNYQLNGDLLRVKKVINEPFVYAGKISSGTYFFTID